MTFEECLDTIEEGFYAVLFVLLIPLFLVWYILGALVLIFIETFRP